MWPFEKPVVGFMTLINKHSHCLQCGNRPPEAVTSSITIPHHTVLYAKDCRQAAKYDKTNHRQCRKHNFISNADAEDMEFLLSLSISITPRSISAQGNEKLAGRHHNQETEYSCRF